MVGNRLKTARFVAVYDLRMVVIEDLVVGIGIDYHGIIFIQTRRTVTMATPSVSNVRFFVCFLFSFLR